jgi:uncharacterized protein
MVDNPKEFLGVGWKFPIQIGSDNRISLSTYEEDIKESVIIILSTRKGERIMRPDFGCGIHDFVFENMNSSIIGRIKSSVRESLVKYEPRINVTDVQVSAEDLDSGKLIITIHYFIRATNNPSNLVYPFFIKEGVR